MSREKSTLAGAEDMSEAEFVTRWSRLKHRAKDTEATATGNTTVSSAAGNAGPEQAPASPADLLTDQDMPPIESLTADSSYADFLSPGVSDGLRKLALRKLFHAEAFNIRDGLDEYDDDFTRFEKMGDIVTSDMRHQVELEAQRKAEQLMLDDDQLTAAESTQGMETDKDEAAPIDQNMNVTAGVNPKPDEVLTSADTEKTGETGSEANSDEIKPG